MNHSLADTPVELRDKKCREKKREKKNKKNNDYYEALLPVSGGQLWEGKRHESQNLQYTW